MPKPAPWRADLSLQDKAIQMQYWLMKSEPAEISIDDVLNAPRQTIPWFGVRNYQARNYMRDLMKPGDGVLFYHSSCAEPGIAGLAEVASSSYPDHTQYEKKSKYFDPKATPEQPRWMMVDVKAIKKTRLIPLAELRETPELADMLILKRGNRLSITPVTAAEWRHITRKLLK
jgi:predicted RNA-binding protein with PUA-like domain